LEEIINAIDKKAKEFSEIVKNHKGMIRIFTHHDADGISSGAIISKALEYAKKEYTIKVIRQLEDSIISELSDKESDLFIFTDLGSGQKEIIQKYLPKNTVIIADHHQGSDLTWDNLYELNCHHFGVDGKDEISGSGVTYFLARAIAEQIKNHSELVLIGAAGDTQKVNGEFKSLNKYLLSEVVKANRIKIITGLRLFGRYTRPLHKSLVYLDSPRIEGVTGNESSTIQMLCDLQIPIRQQNGDWTTLSRLDKNQEKRLITEILIRSEEFDNKSCLIGKVYILPYNYELREFATMLNACGRLNRGHVGLDLCLGKRNSIKDTLDEYRRKIAKYLGWVNRNKSILIKKKNATYLVARDSIDENFIGTVMSIISRSADNTTKIMFGFANSDTGVKVSARADSSLCNKVNIGEAILKVIEEIGGEGGGHSLAAGAKIKIGSELEFIEKIDILLDYE
jgi:single-stranded-DNA-specific exonuclease